MTSRPCNVRHYLPETRRVNQTLGLAQAPVDTGGWVYPPGMTRERPPPPPERRAQRGSRDVGQPGESQPGESRPREAHQAEQSPGEPQRGEHYGPVVVARHVKDDGRALLLYTREPESP